MGCDHSSMPWIQYEIEHGWVITFRIRRWVWLLIYAPISLYLCCLIEIILIVLEFESMRCVHRRPYFPGKANISMVKYNGVVLWVAKSSAIGCLGLTAHCNPLREISTTRTLSVSRNYGKCTWCPAYPLSMQALHADRLGHLRANHRGLRYSDGFISNNNRI